MKRSSMAEALSNAAGHSFSRAPSISASIAPEVHPVPPVPRKIAQTGPPSRIGKKPVTGFFEPAVSRQLKRVGLDQEKTMQELIQEASTTSSESTTFHLLPSYMYTYHLVVMKTLENREVSK